MDLTRPGTRTTALRILALALAMLGGGGFPVGPGSGALRTEARDVAPFTAIDLRNVGEAVVEAGPTTSMEIDTENNLVPCLTTSAVDGSGTVHADGVAGTDFAADVNGSGDVSASGAAEQCRINVERISARVAGPGNVTNHSAPRVTSAARGVRRPPFAVRRSEGYLHSALVTLRTRGRPADPAAARYSLVTGE